MSVKDTEFSNSLSLMEQNCQLHNRKETSEVQWHLKRQVTTNPKKNGENWWTKVVEKMGLVAVPGQKLFKLIDDNS